MSILELLSERPRPAKELASELDLSLKTIYRHVESLEEHELVREQQLIDDSGNHYAVYETSVDEVEVTISPEAGEIDVEVRPKDNVDSFVTLWSGLSDHAKN